MQSTNLLKIPKNKLPYFTQNKAELTYFIGYSGSHGGLLILPDHFFFFTDGRYYERYKALYPQNTVLLKPNQKMPEVVLEHLYPTFTHLFLNFHFFTYPEILLFRKTMKKKVSLKNDCQTINLLRSVKNKEEIQKIKKSVQILEECLALFLPSFQEGMTEYEAANEIDYLFRKKNASPAFDTIVLFGENTAYPHGQPGERKLSKGDVVLIDCGVRYENYCSDMTRTFAFGFAEVEFQKDYALLLDLQKQALLEIKKNIHAFTLDQNLREKLKKHNKEQYFVHSLGHGVGIEVHEKPFISQARKKEKLLAGNVFTIEPGIYIPGKYGIRIEDMVCIHPFGKIEVLTTFPKDLLVIK